jgi:hypothetical protein
MPMTQADDNLVNAQLEIITAPAMLNDSTLKIMKLGEPVEVAFSVEKVDPHSHFDIYVALQAPAKDGEVRPLWYLNAEQNFSPMLAPYLSNQQTWNGKITILSYQALPSDIEWVGQYVFYAVLVPAGTALDKVLEPSQWASHLASDQFFLTRTK